MLWVILQFTLLSLLLWPFAPGRLTLPGVALLLASLLLSLWTLWHNRPGNFNIHPQPHPRGNLVTTGPYRWIRHPMYSAVLLLGLAAALYYGGLWKWAAEAGLVVVLWFKARAEERLLLSRYPGYAAYRQRTRALIPFLW